MPLRFWLFAFRNRERREIENAVQPCAELESFGDTYMNSRTPQQERTVAFWKVLVFVIVIGVALALIVSCFTTVP